jgi:hypothetical protein
VSADAPETAPTKITRADIEAKLGELTGDVEGRVEQAKISATVIAVVIGVTAVVAAYWFGRRRTRKRQTVLEIRRI